MKRIKLTVSYDGTDFHGSQVQPGTRTVQGQIEKALATMHKGEDIRVTASGRTDRHVHAMGQVIHFDTSLQIAPERWTRALNTLLPADIRVLTTAEASEGFHARFSAKSKEYRYWVNRKQVADVLRRNYEYHYPYKLDVESMREAACQLLGTHDFTSFSSAKSNVGDRVRTMTSIELVEAEGRLLFRFVGNGFLYNMVRILVGTLLEVGAGNRLTESISAVLEAKDRTLAGKTAPAHGLVLWKVDYEHKGDGSTI